MVETKKTKPQTSENVMDFLNPDDNLHGFEGINASTTAIPFLRLIQKGSPQLNPQKKEYIEDAKVGMYFNSVTKELYGADLEIIVLQFDQIFIEWKPNRGGFVQMHSPENAARLAVDQTFGKWKTANGNLLSENYVYLVLVAEHESDGPMVLSLTSTMIKTAKQWNRVLITKLLPKGQRAMPYTQVYRLTSIYQENELGDWYSVDINFLRFVHKEEYVQITDERKVLPQRVVDYQQIESHNSEESVGEKF